MKLLGKMFFTEMKFLEPVKKEVEGEDEKLEREGSNEEDLIEEAEHKAKVDMEDGILILIEVSMTMLTAVNLINDRVPCFIHLCMRL